MADGSNPAVPSAAALAAMFADGQAGSLNITQSLRAMYGDRQYLADFAESYITLKDATKSAEVGSLATLLKRAVPRDDEGKARMPVLTYEFAAAGKFAAKMHAGADQRLVQATVVVYTKDEGDPVGKAISAAKALAVFFGEGADGIGCTEGLARTRDALEHIPAESKRHVEAKATTLNEIKAALIRMRNAK